jgi:hypothetical protein
MPPSSAQPAPELDEPRTIELGNYAIEIGEPSRAMIAVALVVLVVFGILLNSIWQNHSRAEDWRRQAVDAEEVVTGLRVVIGERSQALNRRTAQANELAASLGSSRGALRNTKASVGSLARRQRQLAADKAKADAELQKLRTQRKALASVASALSACSTGLEAVATAGGKKAKPEPALLEQCSKARTRLTQLERAG